MIANPKIVLGLYKYTRDGKFDSAKYKKAIYEMHNFFRFNKIKNYNDFVFLAGDNCSLEKMEELGLKVEKVFEDSPRKVMENKAHLMKHYMIIWAIEKYKEVLWIDWDNLILKWPDKKFWDFCRSHETPKFIYIPDYWATVNCGVYYANIKWKNSMENILELWDGEPNDELLWAAVLPHDINDRKEFWFGDLAINIWAKEEISLINKNTYFAHIKTFEYYKTITNQLGGI